MGKIRWASLWATSFYEAHTAPAITSLKNDWARYMEDENPGDSRVPCRIKRSIMTSWSKHISLSNGWLGNL